MSIILWLDESNVVSPCHGILFGNKKGWSTDTYCDMAEPWRHYEKLNQLNRKDPENIKATMLGGSRQVN